MTGSFALRNNLNTLRSDMCMQSYIYTDEVYAHVDYLAFYCFNHFARIDYVSLWNLHKKITSFMPSKCYSIHSILLQSTMCN